MHRSVRDAAILTTILVLTLTGLGFSQTPAPAGKKWAVVNGETITDEQVKKAAADELENLDLRKAQTEVGFERDRQSIYEKTLTNIVDNKLLAAEAKKRGVSVEDLLRAEVESKITPATDKEANDFYEANKSRINGGGPDLMQQIKQYLTQRKRDDAYSAFTAKLRQDYKVENDLEPQRWPVETQGHPALGPAGAPVTIVEFSDFECPFCGQQFPILKKIEADFGGKIRVVYRQMPLTNLHPHA